MWELVVHGGCGALTRETVPPPAEAAARAGLLSALEAGQALLARGGAALDAVEAAVCVLEDDPVFNAGRGSVFTAEGHVECDAAIMAGHDLKAGAIAGVRTTRNPVTLARAVMDHSPHVFLAGSGAEQFARLHDVEQVEPGWFETANRRAQLERVLAQGEGAFDIDVKYGTVGAVARDDRGNLAAATSTGGLTGKRWGRVGDSPLIGSGTYADGRTAVSCTGSGEHFIRLAAAHEFAARVRLGREDAADAAAQVITEIGRLGGKGGLIFLASENGGWRFNTAGMNRGRVTSTEPPYVAIFGGEA